MTGKSEEPLHFYMVANNITDSAKKQSILLTIWGDQTFKLLRSLVPDGKLDADDITNDSLVRLLKLLYKKLSCISSTSILVLGSHLNPSPTTLQLFKSSQWTVTSAWKRCCVIIWFAASTTKASNTSYCLKVTSHTRMLLPSLSP